MWGHSRFSSDTLAMAASVCSSAELSQAFQSVAWYGLDEREWAGAGGVYFYRSKRPSFRHTQEEVTASK